LRTVFLFLRGIALLLRLGIALRGWSGSLLRRSLRVVRLCVFAVTLVVFASAVTATAASALLTALVIFGRLARGGGGNLVFFHAGIVSFLFAIAKGV
jgi:hypothetical protein